jgi:hypothetical protein
MLSPAPSFVGPTKPARHRSKPKPSSRPLPHKSPSLRFPSNERESPPPISRYTPRLRNVAPRTRNVSGHFPPTLSILDPARNLHSPTSTRQDSPRPHPSISTQSSSRFHLRPSPPQYFASRSVPPAPFDHACGCGDPHTSRKTELSHHNKAAPTQNSSASDNPHALESDHRHSRDHDVHFVYKVHPVHSIFAPQPPIVQAASESPVPARPNWHRLRRGSERPTRIAAAESPPCAVPRLRPTSKLRLRM